MIRRSTSTAGRAVAGTAAVVALLAGCGVAPSGGLEDIDAQSLPQRLIVSAPPSTEASTPPVSTSSGVYFLRDDHLAEIPRTLTVTTGPGAVQQLLDLLTAGPDSADRDRGCSTALPPGTRLRLTSLDGDLATVDLTVNQTPPDQTMAIAQIVLTVTSLDVVSALRLTIGGEPFSAPLASGAQTERPLTRADFADLLS